MSNTLADRIAQIQQKRAQTDKVGPSGERKLPKKRKGKKLVPLFKEWSDYVPEEAKELSGSCEDFLHTFSPEMSLLQQMVFDGKAKHFEGSSGLILKKFTDLYESGELFPNWPKKAKIPPLAYHFLTGTFKWDEKTEAEILPDLEALGVSFEKAPRTTTEKPPVASEVSESGTEEEDEGDGEEDEEDEDEE